MSKRDQTTVKELCQILARSLRSNGQVKLSDEDAARIKEASAAYEPKQEEGDDD